MSLVADVHEFDETRIKFADERFTVEEAALHRKWRPLTACERSILDRLLAVDFRGRSAVAAESVGCRVRQMDRCGCLEFKTGTQSHGDAQIVAEGAGATDPEGIPVEIMLTLAGDHLLWLEFHRYGGSNDFHPEAELFHVYPFG